MNGQDLQGTPQSRPMLKRTRTNDFGKRKNDNEIGANSTKDGFNRNPDAVTELNATKPDFGDQSMKTTNFGGYKDDKK